MRCLNFCLLAMFLMLAGCTSVQVDTQPKASLGSSRFQVSPTSCSQLIGSGAILPLDIYHTGVCYEQGQVGSASISKALRHYQEAARWGVPEAKEALERLGQPVPPAELQKQQERQSEQIQDDRSGGGRIKIIHTK